MLEGVRLKPQRNIAMNAETLPHNTSPPQPELALLRMNDPNCIQTYEESPPHSFSRMINNLKLSYFLDLVMDY